MSPRRLTREESQARTRARLLDTAAREFLKKGYHGTSLDRIADLAGYSKGAVYSNFASKEELCLAVLDRHYAGQFVALRDELAHAVRTVDARLEVVERWWDKIIGEQDWRLLTAEFTLHARRNRKLRARLARRDQTARAAIAELLTEQRDELGLTPALEPDHLAVALLGLGAAIALQRLIDPDIPAEVLTETMRALLSPPPAP
ncbi:MAG: TetR/AcrR family transcriptional regulator [Acidimicrobiales bacterium]